MTKDLDAVIREAEDELASERWKALWEVYGKYVVGFVVIGVMAAGGYIWSSEQQQANQLANGQAYVAAAGDYDDYLADTPWEGYQVVAAFEQASQDPATLVTLAQDSSQPTTLRNFALIRLGYQAPELLDESLMRQLNTLAKVTQEATLWQAPALEILALKAASGGDSNKAQTYFAALSALPGLAGGQAERVRAAQEYLSLQANDDAQ